MSGKLDIIDELLKRGDVSKLELFDEFIKNHSKKNIRSMIMAIKEKKELRYKNCTAHLLKHSLKNVECTLCGKKYYCEECTLNIGHNSGTRKDVECGTCKNMVQIFV